MKKTHQPLRIAILSISALFVLQPNALIAGCGGGGCGSGLSGGGGGGGGGFNRAAYLQQKRERAERRTERLLRIEILKEYMGPIDTNNDGSISLSEYLASEGSSGAKERFAAANKNGDRYLTKSEIAKMIGLEEEIKKRK